MEEYWYEQGWLYGRARTTGVWAFCTDQAYNDAPAQHRNDPEWWVQQVALRNQEQVMTCYTSYRIERRTLR